MLTFCPKWSNFPVVPFIISSNISMLLLKRFNFSNALEKFSWGNFFCPYVWLPYIFSHNNGNHHHYYYFYYETTTNIYKRLVTCVELCKILTLWFLLYLSLIWRLSLNYDFKKTLYSQLLWQRNNILREGVHSPICSLCVFLED